MGSSTNGPPLQWVSVKVRPAFSSGCVDVAVWEGGYGERSRCALELLDQAVPLVPAAVAEVVVAVQEATEAALRRVEGVDSGRTV